MPLKKEDILKLQTGDRVFCGVGSCAYEDTLRRMHTPHCKENWFQVFGEVEVTRHEHPSKQEKGLEFAFKGEGWSGLDATKKLFPINFHLSFGDLTDRSDWQGNGEGSSYVLFSTAAERDIWVKAEDAKHNGIMKAMLGEIEKTLGPVSFE